MKNRIAAAGRAVLGMGVALALGAAQAASAAPPTDQKAAACLYELQAESWRFARLQREIIVNAGRSGGANKLRTQIKAATQELMLNLHEAQPGMKAAGLDKQYKRLEDTVADYLAEAAASAGDRELVSLRAKQGVVMKAVDEARGALTPKLNPKYAKGMALIGGAKANVERLAHDFEFCGKAECAQQLPAEMAELERQFDGMRTQLGDFFSKSNHELARNQLIFMRLAVDGRLKSGSPDAGQENLIVSAGHLWEIIDGVLDAFAEKG